MKLYLDNCSIQRPLDDRSQLRIAVEGEIILNVLSLVEAGEIDLFSSEVLIYEASKITNVFRKDFTLKVLSKRKKFMKLTNQIEKRSGVFVTSGIKPLDALHLASAEKMKADFFCTCDDKFLRKAKAIKGIEIKVVSILELVKEIE